MGTGSRDCLKGHGPKKIKEQLSTPTKDVLRTIKGDERLPNFTEKEIESLRKRRESRNQ